MACKHTQEQALDKATITFRPKLEVKYKLLRMTGYKMRIAKVVQSICEEAVKDVPLTKKEDDAIKADIERAREKRMAKRIEVAAYNRGLRSGNFRKGE